MLSAQQTNGNGTVLPGADRMMHFGSLLKFLQSLLDRGLLWGNEESEWKIALTLAPVPHWQREDVKR